MRFEAYSILNLRLGVVVMVLPYFATVLVIDSGIGGISIVKQIRALTDKISTIYIADNAYFPYGNLPPELILSRLETLIRTVQQNQHLDAVVIGCNTATVLMIDKLRQVFETPFVGIVPAVKTAAQVSQNRKFTLLATDNTARSAYINDLIAKFAKDCDVLRVSCVGLADIAEAKIYGTEAEQKAVEATFLGQDEQSLAHIKASDVILLGCTHYAFLLPELRRCFADHQQIIEPSLPVAKRLMWVLENQATVKKELQISEQEAPMEQHNRFYFTQSYESNAAFKWFLHSHGFETAEVLF
ncbi:glutamate racemase [Alteromonas sp. a30]|uniref:glutamate racemase n=1 Tax=Alteromonas sp. a30 TaxID=2730917 RepID=UPI00227E94AB|nr:glutamate racemase [Alteromonas sp. a30]MCY7297349.1 glutamate racemase [Alteromonas sp. a30]